MLRYVLQQAKQGTDRVPFPVLRHAPGIGAIYRVKSPEHAPADYIFTAPVVRPDTKYFCSKR